MMEMSTADSALHEVVIAGGGPTGLMLAGELALAGVDVAIVERRPSQGLAGSRAGGLHARTLELLDQRGIVERFLSSGQRHAVLRLHGATLDIGDFPTRHNYVLGLLQNHTERILAEWVTELAVKIYRDSEVIGITQDPAGIDIDLSDGRCLRAGYLAGCDGGRSIVRKAAGIEFPGADATTSWMIAEVATTSEPEWGFRRDALGSHAIGKVDDGRRATIVLVERQVGATGEPTMRDLCEALVAVYGTDFGAHDPSRLARFSDMTRQAASYRDRRVLLAGDAAHVHPPQGGQGLNLGVQDAVNLGWKLAQVVRGTSQSSLLDTYHTERHPVGARVLEIARRQVEHQRRDERANDSIDPPGMDDGTRKRLVAEISGLGIGYDLGEGHLLVGRRMPDLDIDIDEGSTRVFALLRDALPLFLQFEGTETFDIAPWTDRVRHANARGPGSCELPVVGTVAVPAAILVRPDGYVAWAGDRFGPALVDALTRWFGAPNAR
jgi:3-(3-hydroxy-phenyl)propionate hydroxylase